MKVHLESLGCRLNWSEVEELTAQFTGAGHTVSACPREADAILVNTCAVTAAAERKTLRRISALSRQCPDARIAVIGCYATLARERCARLPGVEWVIPNNRKEGAFQAMTGCDGPEPGADGPCRSTSPAAIRRTRAFLKVQDGCDNHCTYCVTSRLRGPARSRPLPEIITRARALVEEGRQEIVITGLNLGAYGRDSAVGASLQRLVKSLLDETNVPRLRLSSIEPWDVDESFLELWADPRLCRQLHVPRQAGCDGTLARMGRPITAASFAHIVQAARAAAPNMAITTDMIAGFPGEDEAMFQASYDFATSMAFARIHVFTYSPRPGTPAARFHMPVPRTVRHDRAGRLRSLGTSLASQYRDRFVGQRMDVLWERRRADGTWRGLTDNYLRVVARTDVDLHNRILPTTLIGAENGHLVGRIRGIPSSI